MRCFNISFFFSFYWPRDAYDPCYIQFIIQCNSSSKTAHLSYFREQSKMYICYWIKNLNVSKHFGDCISTFVSLFLFKTGSVRDEWWIYIVYRIYAAFTLHIYIYIYILLLFFLASYLYPKIYISQFTRVVFTLLTRMSLHRDVFVTIKRRFNSFKSMQHSLTNGSLKALSIYTDLPMIPLFRILTLIQNIDHFIKTKYNRESRYFGSR